MELDPSARELATSRLLLSHDHESVVASMADHDDEPVSLVWSTKAGGLTYFSSAAGPVAVNPDRLRRWRVNVPAVLTTAVAGFDLGSKPPFELIEGLLWEIGDARFGKRKTRVPIWLTRRLWDRSVQRQIVEAAQVRPHQRQRVILTSSNNDRFRDFAIPGSTIVSLQDVLASPDALAIDAEILSARLSGVTSADVVGPIVLSSDGTQLSVNGGKPIRFRSEAHIAAIRAFVAAYRAGQKLRARDVTTTGNLSRHFGTEKWKLLRPFLKSEDGFWGFEP